MLVSMASTWTLRCMYMTKTRCAFVVWSFPFTLCIVLCWQVARAEAISSQKFADGKFQKQAEKRSLTPPRSQFNATGSKGRDMSWGHRKNAGNGRDHQHTYKKGAYAGKKQRWCSSNTPAHQGLQFASIRCA